MVSKLLRKCRVCGKETEALNGLCLECELKEWEKEKEQLKTVLYNLAKLNGLILPPESLEVIQE